MGSLKPGQEDFKRETECEQWFQIFFCLSLSGSSSKITEQNLKGSDIDSDPLKLSYMLTSDPAAGTLLLNKKKLSAKGPSHSFTQEDVNKGWFIRSGQDLHCKVVYLRQKYSLSPNLIS